MTVKQGIKYSNGFPELIGVLFGSFVLLLVNLGGKLYLLSIFFGLIIVIFAIILFLKYRKINRIIKNQEIIHTKILESKSAYYGFQFTFRLVTGPIYLLSSYFDDLSGRVFMFESFCASKTFKKIGRYMDDKCSLCLPLKSIDVCVNKNNYNEYFFVLDNYEIDEEKNFYDYYKKDSLFVYYLHTDEKGRPYGHYSVENEDQAGNEIV